VDPNVAVITGIALDHQDWLGNTRELIAIEKAGILRPNIPVVIGEPNPPVTLNEAAQAVAVKPLWQGVNFRYQIDNTGFNWQGMNHQYRALPVPHIPAQNASTALQVLEILGVELEHQQMVQVFSNTQLLGRRQIIQHQPTVMLDVAHNPQATALLANDLKSKRYRSVIAVVGMLTDKDIKASLAPMLSVISTWHCATLNVPRGASANTLFSILSAEKKVLNFNSVETAFLAALEKSAKDDLIIVFGSFFTVADVLKVRSLDNQKEVE
jgi:dihydrofolate synthase/folylpolyglutamate synthase